MKPVKLTIPIQNYAWGQTGDDAYLKQFFNLNENGPFAEAWIGAHKNGTAKITETNELITNLNINPKFLMKILAAQSILSIQVHPTKERAKEVFKTQTEKIYNDNNHKPEIAIPITEFFALAGFKPYEKIVQTFKQYNIPIEAETRKGIFEQIMRLPQERINQILDDIIKPIRGKEFPKDTKEYWMLKADEIYTVENKYDVGMFCFFMLHIIHLTPLGEQVNTYSKSTDTHHLQPGEGLFTDAGILHSYMEGVIIEVMANSDNVARAGLTPKPKFVDEVLAVTTYEEKPINAIIPKISLDTNCITLTYNSPAKEFSVTHTIIDNGEKEITTKNERFIVVIEGTIKINDLTAKKGEVIMIPKEYTYKITGNGKTYEAY